MNYELWTQVIRVVNTTKEHKQPSRRVRKTVLKMCSKFAGEHPCRSVILIKLQINFIEITLRHGCSPVNLLHIFRTHFLKKTSGRLLLKESIRTIMSMASEFSFFKKLLFSSCPQFTLLRNYQNVLLNYILYNF